MATVNPIEIGAEVKCRDLPDTPVGYVTMNTEDHFCIITKTGRTYDVTRKAANPNKTGRYKDVEGFLKMLNV